jgi:hypothetical protein
MVAALDGSLVLVGTSLTPGAAEEIVRHDPANIVAVGGTGVVSSGLMTAVRALFDTADGVTAAAPRISAPSPVPSEPKMAEQPVQPLVERPHPDLVEALTTLPWDDYPINE